MPESAKLGVPARPTTIRKEAPDMALRPAKPAPNAPTPTSTAPTSTALAGIAPSGMASSGMASSGIGGPQAAPAAAPRPESTRPPAPVARPERRTLVVGRGISLSGTITDCERLVVEGTVEAALHNGSQLTIASGGTFKGEIELDEADVTGTFDGAMTVRVALVVRATGRVLGNVRTRRLTVEEGGQISGSIEMISEKPPTSSMASGMGGDAPGAGSVPARPAFAPAPAEVAAGD
jgi:cytoskeletal protein CcmA (bactofilin family)